MEPYTMFWNVLYRDSTNSTKTRRGMNETLRGVSPGKGNRSSQSMKAPTSPRHMATDGKTSDALYRSAQQLL
jgi:hypothetical protein